jgi:5S rRNA maturation endonuclease (ribonuclease M5)
VDYSERIRQLEFLITRLIETNREVPVIVEGEQDVRCLRALGLTGTILKVHNGRTLYEFCLDLSSRYRQVILLMDWDRKGQQIHEQLIRDLEADWMPYDSLRQGLKFLCHPDIQEVEQLGRHLETLKHLEEKAQQENRPC